MIEDALDAIVIAPTVNSAPVAIDDTGAVTENQIQSFDVLANDTDADLDSLTLTAVSVAAGKGTVSIVNGEVRFNPGSDFDDLAIGTIKIF